MPNNHMPEDKVQWHFQESMFQCLQPIFMIFPPLGVFKPPPKQRPKSLCHTVVLQCTDDNIPLQLLLYL